MKKDTHETRGRPRENKYEKSCALIRAAIVGTEFHLRPKGHVITVESGPVVGQIHCAYSYKELRDELGSKNLGITAYNHQGQQVFRVRKLR